MADVILRKVQKSFGDVAVLRDIDLEIRDGEFMVFVGPSGCGKSTLLRTIAGLEEVTGGELSIGGRVVNDVPPAERGIAMVFQSYALYPHMNLYDNMAFGLQLAHVPKAEIDSAVQQAAKILHIDHLLQRKPKDLSGGQRQRVAIGRAIVRKPEVFLFDEPLSNLDAALRVKMRVEFARLHEQLKTTMVYVTHDQVEAMTMGDRIAVLNAGRIEQVGRPMDLYREPDNLFVAGFLGTPRINLMPRPETSAAGTHVTLWQALQGAPAGGDASRQGARHIGIRPEHLHLVSEGGVEATVVMAEHLGDSSILHLRVEGLPDLLQLRRVQGEPSTGGDLQTGQTVRITPDARQALAFDDTGKRVA